MFYFILIYFILFLDLNKSYVPEKKYIKDYSFESKNKRDASFDGYLNRGNYRMRNNNHKENSIFNIMDKEIIKKLRIKLQKQEIDLKFLNEKIKKYEDEESKIDFKQNFDDNQLKNKLNEKEVNIF